MGLRILIVFPRDGETDQALVDACRSRGHEVDSICARRESAGMFQRLIDHRGKIDLVLMSRTEELYFDFVSSRDRYPHIKFAIWNVDVRQSLEEWGLLVNFVREVDYYFTVALGVVDRWTAVNPNTFYVPQGIQIERYHDTTPTEESVEKYLCDVSFIGNVIDNVHLGRQSLIETLKRSHYDFRHFTGIYGEEHNQAVACSKINLAVTHSPDIPYYVSVRDWKIIAARGILLEQWHEGLDDMFGGNVTLYDSETDCLNKISEILGDYKTYEKKAFELWEWAMDTQTYAHRIDQIVGILEGDKSCSQ